MKTWLWIVLGVTAAGAAGRGASEPKAGDPGEPGVSGPPTELVPVDAATLYPASVATSR